MKLLLSNDDGIEAPGLEALEVALRDLGTVWVVAPEKEHSAKSHAFTLHKPLRIQQRGERRFAVSGTPADCAYVGLHEVIDGPPDVVVTGINRGANLGNDVFYSGTVAGAMEATMQGFSAVAVSLDRRPAQSTLYWQTAAKVARTVVQGVLEHGLPPRVFLNVNVPNVRASELRGIKVAKLGQRKYSARVDMRRDPFGRRYYWIGGEHVHFSGGEETDGVGVEAGWATVTPMHPDLTRHDFLDELGGWFGG